MSSLCNFYSIIHKPANNPTNTAEEIMTKNTEMDLNSMIGYPIKRYAKI